MYSDTRYHALNQGLDENGNDDLWDQLDDVESREVEQHQSRFQGESSHSRNHATVILASMATSSAERIRTAATSAMEAAQQAWNNQRRRTRVSDNTDLDLDRQFGIQDLRPNGFEDEIDDQQNHSGFKLLSRFSRQAISSARESHGLVGNLDVFLTHLYHYYYHRGLVPIVCNFIVEASTLLVTFFLSRMLIRDVDWRKLATCKVSICSIVFQRRLDFVAYIIP